MAYNFEALDKSRDTKYTPDNSLATRYVFSLFDKQKHIHKC